jgi:hypothetical protein
MPEPDDQSPLWSFPAAQEISEVLEWRTDVLQARAGEQRIALRPPHARSSASRTAVMR